VWFRIYGKLEEWLSVTDLETDEAIREAWTIRYAEPAASPSACRLAAALLAVTGGTQTHPHWVTPDDLWRDRLAVLADQGAWLAAWGPRPGEPDCRKARRGARTLICCGAQPCGSAPMTTTGAGPRPNRDPDAAMMPNNPHVAVLQHALPSRLILHFSEDHFTLVKIIFIAFWPQ
jgi:hypothetical protein